MRREPQIDRLSDFMLTQSFFSKSDCPRQIDRYIDFFGRSASSWIPPEISQPSTKTLQAVDKLVSDRKAKAAKNITEPRVLSDGGRFVGVRVNKEDVTRLPTFPIQWAIDDPRQRPYIAVVWANGAYALKMAVSQRGEAVVVTLVSGSSYRVPIVRRAPPRGGTTLFYRCPWCRKPRRFLYLLILSGHKLVDYLGPRCRECAGLRFASQAAR